MSKNFNSDENKTVEEINEEIEQAFESGEFDEPEARKPQFFSFKFLIMLAILTYFVYKIIQTFF